MHSVENGACKLHKRALAVHANEQVTNVRIILQTSLDDESMKAFSEGQGDAFLEKGGDSLSVEMVKNCRVGGILYHFN